MAIQGSNIINFVNEMSVPINVTRSGDLLDFGQLFKATIDLPKSPTFLGKFRKGVKNLSFSSEFIFG